MVETARRRPHGIIGGNGRNGSISKSSATEYQLRSSDKPETEVLYVSWEDYRQELSKKVELALASVVEAGSMSPQVRERVSEIFQGSPEREGVEVSHSVVEALSRADLLNIVSTALNPETGVAYLGYSVRLKGKELIGSNQTGKPGLMPVGTEGKVWRLFNLPGPTYHTPFFSNSYSR